MKASLTNQIDPRISTLVEKFWQRLYQPASTIDASWIRVIVFGVFAYKLLSRDFSVFGFAPASMLYLYPADLFHPRYDFLMLGFQPIVDAVTFHWVHWFLPLPNMAVLQSIQYTVIGLCLITMVFGRGPRAIFAIATFIGLNYIFGFLWRVGHDVDAVFVPLQIALVYCFSRHQEWTLVQKPKEFFSSDAGWFCSMAILCFVGYYFLSGVNKITDISPVDWFNYHISDIIHDQADKITAGSHAYAPVIFSLLSDLRWLGYIVVPLVYLSHLAIPIIFFRREYVANFFIFYMAFHLISLGVGIFFFALVLTWLSLLPVHRFITSIWIEIDPSKAGLQTAIQMFVRRRTGNNIELRESQGKSIRVFEHGSKENFVDFRAFRRLCWSIPLCWPILPMLYVPGLELLANSIVFRD